MQFLIITLALVSSTLADVSHLNNEYLPPVLSGSADSSASAPEFARHEIEYAEQTNEVPEPIGADSYTPDFIVDKETPLQSIGDIPAIEEVPQDVSVDSYDLAPPAVVEAQPATHEAEVVEEQPAVDEYVLNVDEQPAVEEFVPERHTPVVVYGDVPEQPTVQDSLGEEQPGVHYFEPVPVAEVVEEQPAVQTFVAETEGPQVVYEDAPAAEVIDEQPSEQHPNRVSVLDVQRDAPSEVVEEQPAEEATAELYSDLRGGATEEQQTYAEQPAAEAQAPTVIYGDVPEYPALRQQEAAASGIDTQYSSNGGYVY